MRLTWPCCSVPGGRANEEPLIRQRLASGVNVAQFQLSWHPGILISTNSAPTLGNLEDHVMVSPALSAPAFAVALFIVQVPQAAIPTSDVLPADELLFDDEPIQVIVDMDSKSPGIQSIVQVSSCTTTVHDVAIYILDPLGERFFWWIGFVGGIDRGIAFGHMPGNSNVGSVADMEPTIGTPVNPGNNPWVVQTPGLDPAFEGPEVQYIESGSPTPAVIPSQPSGPIFTVDITLDGALPGDRFNFYLFDFISVWTGTGGKGGAFSTQGPFLTLDTGGDVVPDGTDSIYGVDADAAVPVPPASFLVDYVDGPAKGGPAVIEVLPVSGDLDADGLVGASDLAILLGSWGPCAACAADFNGDGVVNASDLAVLLGSWGSCE